MIFLNLFIGVIMNGMDEARAEMAEADEAERRLAGEKIDEVTVDDLEKKLEEMQELIVKLKRKEA
jgi:voltage-gated sodium channel